MSRDDRTVVFQLPTMISGQLACIAGTVAGRSWELSAGTFVIGRLPTSDLPLPQEPGVSKVHAKIIAEGDRYTLVDAESRNGTIVNGQPVQRAVLKDGDEIRVCGCVLRFTQTGGGGGVKNPPSRLDAAPLDPPTLQTPPRTPPPASSPGLPPPSPTNTGFGPHSTEAFPVVDPAQLVERAPPPEAVQAPRPVAKAGMGLFGWFATGLLLSVVVVGGAFGALRLLGEELADEGEVALAETRGGEPANAASPAADAGRVAMAATAGAPTADAEAAAVDDAQAAASVAATAPGESGDAGGETPGEEGAIAPTGAAPATTSSPPDEPATTESPEPAEAWVPVEVNEPSPAVIRARSGGRIRTVEVEDGARVEKNQPLAELEEQADAAEIATLKESIRALESVAESQESAKIYLDQEKAKLQRLLTQQRNARVTAPASGTLVGFSLKVGDRIRARQVLGKVRTDAGATLTASVPRARGQRLKRGAPVKLRTRDGEVVSGTISALRKRGDSYQVTLNAGSVSIRDVDEVSFE